MVPPEWARMVTRSVRFISFAVILPVLLVPLVAFADRPPLSVSPTSFSLQAYVGSNVPDQTAQVAQVNNGSLKWTITALPASWLSVSPKTGGAGATITLTFATAALSVGQYQTSFVVASGTRDAVTVNVQVNIVAAPASPPPPPPSDDWTFCAVEGAFCAFTGTQEVRYGANGSYVYRIFTGGTACTNGVFGDPLFGTVKACATKPTLVQLPPPPAAPVYGPRASITCPGGAINIWPGENIQSLVDLFPGATTFCLKAGIHPITYSTRPKSGDSFIGEYGAILDGSSWVTSEEDAAAFRAHNEDIDDVTIRNLVIRKMPQRGIHAYYWASDRWTIEYNEVTGTNVGVAPPNNSIIRNNNIHDNGGGGYLVFRASNTVFESNEFAFNGKQKVVAAVNITFRNNFVHHNGEDGIFYDGDCSGGLIEGNIVEDNNREGIFYEISSQGVIRNNTLRRNAYSGIFISTSKGVEIYNNLLEDNFRGIQYFLNCEAVGGGSIGYDLANNTAHDNTVKVGTAAGAFANTLTHLSSCTATQVAPYLSGLKGLKFINNQYIVPSTTAKYLVWGFGTAGLKSWAEWQALGNDLTGLYQNY